MKVGGAPSLRIPLSVDLAWKIGAAILLVVGQYYALKGQVTESVYGLDKRVTMLEQAKVQQEGTENARHNELTARLSAIDTEMRRSSGELQSIDNFTQRVQGDVQRLAQQLQAPSAATAPHR